MAGLILTPLILSRLGLEAYSYWPLCNALTVYVGVVTTSLGVGLRRHTVSALDRGDLREAREYFHTGLAMMLGLWLILVLTGFLLSARLSSLVQIRPELQPDVQRMFLLIALAVSLWILCTVFFVGAYAQDRLYTEKIAGAGSTLLRLLMVYLAFALWAPSLTILGVAALVSSAVTLLIAVASFSRYLPEMGMWLPRCITGRAMIRLGGFGGWVLCGAVGVYLFQSLSLVLANRLFGPAEAGRFGVVFQVTTLVAASMGHIGYVLSRRLIGLLSRGDAEEAEVLLRRYYTWTMGAFALPLALLFIHAEPLLGLWLGGVGDTLGPLLRIGLLAVFLVEPLAMINARLLASNRVVTNGVTSLLMGPALLGLATALSQGLDWGVAGIIAACGVIVLARNLGLLADGGRTCNLCLGGLARGFAVGVLAFAGVVLIGYVRARITPMAGLSGLVWDSVLGTGVWAAILWRFSPDCRFLAQGLTRRLALNPGGCGSR